MNKDKSRSLSKPFPSKAGPFVILLCLTPDDFTSQGWERVHFSTFISLFNLSQEAVAFTCKTAVTYCIS